MKSFEQLAQSAYAAYCKAVGGTAFDSTLQQPKPLPTYQQLGQRQQAGWVAATRQVVAEHAAVH